MALSNRPFAAALAKALALGALAAPSVAAPTQTRAVTVKYSDLDLASEDGRKTLDERLERAAREVCGMDEQLVGTRITDRRAIACYKEARAELDRQFASIVERSRRGA